MYGYPKRQVAESFFCHEFKYATVRDATLIAIQLKEHWVLYVQSCYLEERITLVLLQDSLLSSLISLSLCVCVWWWWWWCVICWFGVVFEPENLYQEHLEQMGAG